MEWLDKHSGILITWFGSLFVVATGMYWRLKQSEKDLILLKHDIKSLKEESARKNEVDIKLEKLEGHLTEQIKRVEADIKNQNDLTRNFIEKVYNKFDTIQKDMNEGFTKLTNTIFENLRKG